MSDLVPKVPGKIDRKRQHRAAETIEFQSPDGANPQSQLETELAEVESSKKILGLNVASQLTAASQRGFAMGLRQGLQEGALTEASFFSDCITTAGATLR